MSPTESVNEFTAFAAARGVNLSSSTARNGLEQMLAFYASVPATDCGGPDGDMLLFQWGTYDWGDGRHFELNITRQFIVQGLEDDDAISQLSLTYRFTPNPELDALADGNRWCHGLSELPSFNAFVLSSPACVSCANVPIAGVELVHSHV
jgi:hypothetical protein